MGDRGFTLVELMVIVAIIGLFSMIALTSLSSSRNKGNDAAVRQELKGLQNAAELYAVYSGNKYATGSGVGTGCTLANTMFASPGTTAQGKEVVKLVAAAEAANGATNNLTCMISSSAYAVSSPLRDGGHWCVDSQGASKSIASPVATTNC